MSSVKMKLIKRITLVITLFFLISAGGFIIYANDYYLADDLALSIYQNDDTLIIEEEYLIVPSSQESDIAIIFYPGAKVEYFAYLPLFNQLSEYGITSILIKMPYNFAFLNIDAANDVIDLLPNIDEWYMAGHSLGGAMASSYASEREDSIDGLILLGSYNYGEYSDENTLIIYGTFNDSLTDKVQNSSNVLLIEGGNHAQFGNYGKQEGDPDATISDSLQQEMTVDAIVEFIY